MNKIKQLREEKRISQVKMAMDLNTTQASISKYERGQAVPDVGMLIQIAQYFQVSVDYLLELTPFRDFSPDLQLSKQEYKRLLLFNGLSSNQKKQAIAYLTGLKDQK